MKILGVAGITEARIKLEEGVLETSHLSEHLECKLNTYNHMHHECAKQVMEKQS